MVVNHGENDGTSKVPEKEKASCVFFLLQGVVDTSGTLLNVYIMKRPCNGGNLKETNKYF